MKYNIKIIMTCILSWVSFWFGESKGGFPALITVNTTNTALLVAARETNTSNTSNNSNISNTSNTSNSIFLIYRLFTVYCVDSELNTITNFANHPRP